MRLQLEMEGQLHQVEIEYAAVPGRWLVRIDDQAIDADATLLRPGVLSLLIGGHSHRVILEQQTAEDALHLNGQVIPYAVEDPRSLRQRRRASGSNGPVTLKASMPGRVVRILLEKGAPVAEHQAVLVIEAMKMQNELKSPREGCIADLRVAPGDTVASGQVLAIIE